MKPEEYEEICPVCINIGPIERYYFGCQVCDGRGKISWIDIIKYKKLIDKSKTENET